MREVYGREGWRERREEKGREKRGVMDRGEESERERERERERENTPHHYQTHQYEFKQGSLVYFEEFLVPRLNVICSLLLVLVILRGWWVILVVSGPLYYLHVYIKNYVSKIILRKR